jgi:competence protein ComFC
MRSAYKDLADLLLSVLPDLPPNTIIVPVPTIPGHIRERGYDHTLLITRYIAKSRGLECKQLLQRVTNTKQRQSSARQREAQARTAFASDLVTNRNCPYLLIDDVVTTGTTIKYAARALKKAGAKNVWVAVIAYQALGE